MKLAGFDVGLEHPIFLIAGTCVIESDRKSTRLNSSHWE